MCKILATLTEIFFGLGNGLYSGIVCQKQRLKGVVAVEIIQLAFVLDPDQ